MHNFNGFTGQYQYFLPIISRQIIKNSRFFTTKKIYKMKIK